MATDDSATRADSRSAIGEALYGLVTLAVKNGPREISLTAASTLATRDRTGARRLTDLAVIEGVTQPSMSVLVTGLEAAGLAERRPDPADKRVVVVGLTPAGGEYIPARRRAGASDRRVPRHDPAPRARQRPQGRGRRSHSREWPERDAPHQSRGPAPVSAVHNGRADVGHVAPVNPFRQPKAVYAVAFACVVSFMGIGLVDPILPALSKQLKASPSEVELLFTSYLVVTAVAMLVTGWVSSRIGGKRTLIAGLVLIVAGSAAAGASQSIGEIIGFRAGWGLGNALFIATSLAVIIGAASGGFSGAIILYETALGVGIALGPLVGGALGGISWRDPFFGVTALMAVALVATIAFVDKTPQPARKTSIIEPLRALKHRGLLVMSLTAL